MDVQAVILAAGKGSRMKSSIAKCIYPFYKKPMIEYIIDALNESNVNSICVVVGYLKEEVMKTIKKDVCFVEQSNPLGTAHALYCAKEFYNKAPVCLVLPSDIPLINNEIITNLINYHKRNNNDFTVLTTHKDNPYGYGRIVMENNGIVKIVEEQSCLETEKCIKEINSGIYCINTSFLDEALEVILRKETTKEYYLTDIIEVLKGKRLGIYHIEDDICVTGINDIKTLNKLEKEYQLRINDSFIKKGVRLIDSNSIVIEPSVVIEEDVTIDSFSIIRGKTYIKKGTYIKPFSYIVDNIFYK